MVLIDSYSYIIGLQNIELLQKMAIFCKATSPLNEVHG